MFFMKNLSKKKKKIVIIMSVCTNFHALVTIHIILLTTANIFILCLTVDYTIFLASALKNLQSYKKFDNFKSFKKRLQKSKVLWFKTFY